MICIERFAEYFVPNPRVTLPERDAFGVLHGSAYTPTHGPAQSKTAMAGNEYDMKSGGSTVFHSLLENALDFRLMLSPFVIEIRPHYPMTLEPKVLKRLSRGERLLKTDVPTIDRVITLQRRDNLQLHLHAVSVKPAELLTDTSVIDRHKREEAYAASRGASWETVGRGWQKEYTTRNLATIRSWCLSSDTASLYAEAVEFAWRLKRGKPVGSSDQRVSRVARAMSITLIEAYRLFGVAVASGLVMVDDRYYLHPARQLHLRRLEDEDVQP